MIFRLAMVLLILLSCSSYAASQTQIAPPGVVKQEPPFRKRIYADKSGTKTPYRLFVPPKYDSAKKYPLVFWFHGGSGRGSDNESQISGENEKGSHIWTTPENQALFPAFVLAAQCPHNANWSDPELNRIAPPLQAALDILALVQKDYPIEPDRIYLVGQSMGGLAVWSLLQKDPGRWAAAVVVSSYDNFTDVPALTEVPLWIFQQDMDQTVPTNLVRSMVKQLKKAGGSPRYTEYHKLHKEVWDEAFADPQLIPWLAAQKQTAPDREKK